jgi:hypothetical protein
VYERLTMAGYNVAQIQGKARELGFNISQSDADKILGEAWDQSIWGADPGKVEGILRSRYGGSSGGGGGGSNYDQEIKLAQARAEEERARQRAEAARIERERRAEEEKLLADLQAKIAGFTPLEDIEAEKAAALGLSGAGGLRQQSVDLGSAVRNLTQTLTDLPAEIKARTAGGVSAAALKRLSERAAAPLQGQLGQRLTQYENITQARQVGEEQVQTALNLAFQTMQQQLIPFETAATLMADRFAQTISLFTNTSKGILDSLMTELNTYGSLAAEDIKRAAELAKQELIHEQAKEEYLFKMDEALKRGFLPSGLSKMKQDSVGTLGDISTITDTILGLTPAGQIAGDETGKTVAVLGEYLDKPSTLTFRTQ